MITELKKIEIAQWLLDPDKQRIVPDDLKELDSELKNRGLEKIYREIELPLVPILEEMQAVGIKVDGAVLDRLARTLVGELGQLEKQIYDSAGGPFNINSPKQLSEVLYDRLKIDIKGIPRRKTGARSTDVEALTKIKDYHPVVPLILRYRELFKVYSTYVMPLKELALASKDGRIHTEFLQTSAATGRLASQNPNLQNIPIMSEWGKKIREAFVAEKGFSLLALDYSQIELRVLASVAGDKAMIQAFQQGQDIHKLTASKVFNVPIEKVISEQRQLAKTLNFGVIYGMGPDALARNTGMSREEAEGFISEYFSDFAEVKRWQEKTIEQARRVGYVENLNGRKRWLPAIGSANRRFAGEAERAGINMPIQSLAADIIKLAMIKVADYLKKEKLWMKQARLLLSIHDELLFEIADDILKEVQPKLEEIMESAYLLAVALKTDAAMGKNWGAL